jgi:hypothetical protein
LKQDLLPKVDPKDRAFCKKLNWYVNDKLHLLMKQADFIWLASSWKDWQAELLPESKGNLEREFGRKVVVFGRKNLGRINLRHVLLMSEQERIDYKTRMPGAHIKTNELMKRTIPEDFVDVSALFCGQDNMCHPFTQEGRLISFDGGHLTADGARFYGQQLTNHPRIRKILGLDRNE